MKGEIVTFIPRGDKTAEENLAAFVDLARNRLAVFGADLPFDKEKWDISCAVNLRGHGNKRHRITFCNIETAGRRTGTSPMAEPFAAFAKSIIRYWQGMRPVENQQARLTAIRCIEAAMRRNGYQCNPVKIDSRILDYAALVVAAETQSDCIAHRVGETLERLAAFLTDNRLVIVPTAGWKNPIKRPVDPNIKFGEEFEKRRDEKLPDQEALEALSAAFRMAKEVADVVVTAGAGLMLATPDRINEVLTLPVHCERDIVQMATGDRRYGLAWASSKGFDDNIRWIGPDSRGLARACIQRLTLTSEPARQIARWYEDNPKRLYLGDDLERLRAEPYLSIHQVKEIVGIEAVGASNAWTWCKNKGIGRFEVDGTEKVGFADLERAIIKLLPLGFPILDKRTGLKYSEALFVVRKYELSRSKGLCYRCLIEAVNINQINDGLGARSEYGFSSVFKRLGLRNSNGDLHRITSHEFRHYLNTIAQIGGASELDIALWSGRADLSHNASYDHMSSDQILDKLRADCDDSLPDAIVRHVKKNAPVIRRSEFSQQVIPAAHANDFGWCTHPYSDSPCLMFRDCINCDEQVCIKGAEGRVENVRRAIEEAEFLLGNHRRERADGAYGADHWVELQTETLERLRQLHSLLIDPSIPDGTPIRLRAGNPPTLLRVALAERHFAFGGDGMVMGAGGGNSTSMMRPLRLSDHEEVENDSPPADNEEGLAP